MSTDFPAVIVAFAEAINAADTEAFVATFTDDGVIDDWGTVRRGHDGVRRWAGSDAIGAGAQMTLQSATIDGAVTEILFDWKSRVFTGQGHAFVTLRDGLISEFRIPAE